MPRLMQRNRLYIHQTTLKWIIVAPQRSRLSLYFISFQTEWDHDKLEIYDGPSESSHLIGTFTGSSNPQGILSTNESLYLEFNSDGSRQIGAFEIEYRLSDDKGITQF